ncbi:MAG: CBS domain-containing protein [Candidatus Omnitrophota bacterium]
MKVIEIAKKEIITVKRSLTLRRLLDIFKGFNSHPLIPVVNEDKILLGIVSSENLLDLLRPQQAKLFKNVPFMEIDEDLFDLDPVPSMGELLIVDDILDTNFISIDQDTSLEEAYKIMRLNNKEHLPVITKQGKIVGMLGIFDIIWQMFKEKEIV